MADWDELEGVTALEDINHYSCEAFAKAGTFTVEVLSRPGDKWSLSIESPTWDFTFELVNRDTLGELAGFLRSFTGRAEFAELLIGSFCGASVQIVKCDEFVDRLILRALGDDVLVYFTMVGGVTDDFVCVVLQAAASFETES